VGFVDIHSHVLYGLDDGAKRLEDSVAMLELARTSGTSDIVASPHASGKYKYRPELVDARIAELNAAAHGIRVHRGCDFHLQMDNIENALADPQKYSINGAGFLLVEFPDLSVFADPEAILLRLLDGGLTPIITHPERNGPLQKRIDDLARWVDSGCYVQVTAGSITGGFGKAAKATAETLLGRGLVHFVASDGHDCVHRPPRLDEAFELLASESGEETVRPLFVENPAAVLRGEPPECDVVLGTQRSRKWYQFWK